MGAGAFELGSDPSRLHGELLEKVRESRKVRQSKEKEWWLAREFLRGNQYAIVSQNQYIVWPRARDKKKVRVVANMCRAAVKTLLAYLLREDPAFTVTPSTGEAEDLNAAMLATNVLYHYWSLLDCDQKRESAGMFTLTMGLGAWKITWDPQAGRKVPIIKRTPRLGLVTPDGMMGESEGWDEEVIGERPEGDVRIDLLSPFEFLPDPSSESFEDLQWAVHVAMRPTDELRTAFPKYAEEIVPTDPEGESGYDKQVLQSFGAGAAKEIGAEKLGRTLVYEYWQKPTREHPQGLRVIFTRQRILQSGPTPEGHDHLPFAVWLGEPVPGEFWPDGVLRDAIPLQKDYNTALSQLVTIRNRFKTWWSAPVGSISEEQINDEDGQIIEHQPGQPPVAHAPPPVPEALLESLKLMREGFEHASGATAILQGIVKGEVRSGRQVAYQGQYAEGRISLDAKHQARFLKRSGRLVLQLVSVNVTEERIARVVGKNRDMEIRHFKGADLRGQHDVQVDAGTLLSFSKSERFNMLNQMLERQVIGPDKFLEMMEISDFRSVLEDVAQDRNNAQRENEGWRTGQPVAMPRAFENHRVHLACHNYFRKSEDYRRLPPEMQQMMVDQHCEVHEQFLVPPPMPGAEGEGGPPPGEPSAPAPTSRAPGQPPPTPGEMQAFMDAAMAQSGQELGEGLPPVPPVADLGPENQH